MSEALILIFILYILYLIMKKPKATTTPKPVSKAKVEAEVKQSSVQPAVKAAPEKSSVKPAPAKKAKATAAKTVTAAPGIPMPERVGLTAGDIWKYLNENGATSVTKLVRELNEEEKVVQRSIGWLSQEGKVSLYTVGRVETIELQE
jgi:winged helix-turn-helix protein DUF2582